MSARPVGKVHWIMLVADTVFDYLCGHELSL